MSACAIAFVSSVTISASTATPDPSCETRSPSGTRRKIATRGSSRKVSASDSRAAEREVEEPASHRSTITEVDLTIAVAPTPGLQPELLDGLARDDRDDRGRAR